jgi:hypothetical protein
VRCAATGPGRRVPWPSTAAATGPCGPGRQSCEASWRNMWPRRKHIWKPWKDAWDEDFMMIFEWFDDFLGWLFGLELGWWMAWNGFFLSWLGIRFQNGILCTPPQQPGFCVVVRLWGP